MKIKAKRVLAAALALLMAFLAACGGEKTPADVGYYVLTSMTMEGDILKQYEEETGTVTYLELREDGTGTLCVLGESGDLTWKPGEITADGETAPYTLEDGVLTLSVEGAAMVFTRGEKDSAGSSGGGLSGQKLPTPGGDDGEKGAASSGGSDDGSSSGGDSGATTIDTGDRIGNIGETITLGEYTAVFQGYALTKDSLDDDVLILNYAFTNGSQEPKIFGFAFPYDATQGGETLYESYGEGLSVNGDERVQPGKTVEVQFALELENTEDDVILEFADFYNEESYTQTIQLSGSGSSASGKPNKPSGGSSSLADYWEDDWYGGWYVSSASGYWEDFETCWWDCCARIEMDDESSGRIVIWDEDGRDGENMVECDVSFGPGTTENGCMMSEDGWFWYSNAEIGHADWIVDPGASMVSQYEHMICIDGTYVDPVDDGEFDYMIFLKPWGASWDDVTDENLIPDYYDWYQSAIQNGMEMPAKIGS